MEELREAIEETLDDMRRDDRITSYERIPDEPLTWGVEFPDGRLHFVAVTVA
jgi:hypothetical protein